MKTKVLWFASIVVVCTALWYFFLSPHHLSISFETGEPPEIVFEHLLEWPVVASDSLEITNEEASRPGSLSQYLSKDGVNYRYNWNIKRTDTTSTRVRVRITALDHPVEEKLNLLIGKGNLKATSLARTRSVLKGLQNKAKTYRVHHIKDSVRASVYCAYIPLRSHITNKAQVMRDNISVVMGFLNANDIPLAGDPFLEITNWERETDSIDFEFCFPVKKTDSMPSPPDAIRFRSTRELEGIKATYNGNYRDSYKAWYYVLERAHLDSREFTPHPVEVFLNDPHGGGDPLKWKALIYLPLKNK